MKEELVLGIDTSNYKTSLALITKKEIVWDRRKFLKIKEGERGLRQSEALFQHVKNLPEMFEELKGSLKETIVGIAYSSRPRPVEGSYMPCFLAGESFARSMGAILNVPVMSFSHQEGHIEAVKHFLDGFSGSEFISCHFSGGTCEVLRTRKCDKNSSGAYDIEIVGGTKDISMGQVLDRAGVAMGLEFPCGEEMDRCALNAASSTDLLTPVKVKDGFLNLSGIETQIQKNIGKTENDAFIKEIFDKLTDATGKMLVQVSESQGINEIIMAGGVSSSMYMRKRLIKIMAANHINIYFGEMNLSSDNAVGTALLGGNALWL